MYKTRVLNPDHGPKLYFEMDENEPGRDFYAFTAWVKVIGQHLCKGFMPVLNIGAETVDRVKVQRILSDSLHHLTPRPRSTYSIAL